MPARVPLGSASVPSFCRHNRLESNCPICSRQPKTAARSAPGRRAPRAARTTEAKRRTVRSGGDLTVRRLSRAADDGYEHDLVPGLRATADAERLASELAFAAARLDELRDDPPGPYADAALADDREEALWLAFLVAYLSPLEGDEPFAAIEAARTPWATGELPDLDGVALGPRAAHDPKRGAATLTAYRAWAQRAGSQAAGYDGDAAWDPARRFDRAYERLSLPGLGRTPRYELLVSLGALGLVDARPSSLQLAEPMAPATLAAKRVFGIGDAINLGRRASDLAHHTGVPIGALDLALLNWSRSPEERITAGSRATGEDRREAIRAALGVDAPAPEA